jgi:phenylacetate-CoA ligase
MYWDPTVETMERAGLERLQLRRLKETVERVTREVPFYGRTLVERGLGAERIRRLEDVRAFPFTSNADLRDNYPAGLLAVPMDDVVRLHTSSGTTGKPKALFFSRRDVENAGELAARCFVMTGVGRGDVFQNMMSYGLFTGGLVMHYGAEKVGCLVIPSGPGNTERQLLLMRDFRTTTIHVTPSYALYLAGYAEKAGIEVKRDLALRKAFVGAEPHVESTRRKIEVGLGVTVYNSYGLSEMNGPGVAFECERQCGMHVWEDQFLMEIVDPETGEVVPDGEVGELVLTTLCREAMPLLRYRTRDITSILVEPCGCGRTHRRIDRIAGRSDDMLIVRGVNVYPQQIERVLMGVPGVGCNYVIELQGLDEMIVRVEVADCGCAGHVERLNRLQGQLVDRLRTEILVKPRVDLVPPGTLPVSEGKAKRVIDRRSL